MSYTRLIKIAIAITALFTLLLSIGLNGSTSTAFAQEPPRDRTGGGGGGGGGNGTILGEIRGVVTDLNTGQPAGGVDVSINGMIVRTDSQGKYSITGLNAGDYTVQLGADAPGSPVQGPQFVNLPSGGLAIVDLQFVTGAAPPIVAPAAAVETPPPAETSPQLPSAGGIMPDNSYYLGSGYALMTQAKTILPLSEAQNVVTPLVSRPILPVPLCGSILVVPEHNLPVSTSQYTRVVEATNLLRVENKSYHNTISLESIKPGYQLCIPVG